MNFELFNSVPSNSELDMSGLISGMESSSPEHLMLSLDEQLLSSLDNGKSMTMPPPSNSNPNNCFYFISNLGSANCSLVETVKDGVSVDGTTNKLYLRNQEDALWLLENKSDGGNMEVGSNMDSLFDNDCFMSSTLPQTTANQLIRSQSVSDCKARDTTTTSDTNDRKRGGRKGILTYNSSSRRSSGVKKASKVVQKYRSPLAADRFLKTLADNVTQQLSKTVRVEVQSALQDLKTYFDGKLTQEASSQQSENSEPWSERNVAGNSKYTQTDEDNSEKDNDTNDTACSEEDAESSTEPVPDRPDFPSDLSCEVATPEQLTESCMPKQPIDLKVKGVFEQKHISTVKYVTSTTMVEVGTLKKNTESNGFDDVKVNNQFPTKVGSLDSVPITLNDGFTFSKYNIVKQEPYPSFEDEMSLHVPSYFELFTLKSNQLVELKNNKELQTTLSPVPIITEPCTALVPYMPLSPSEQNSVVSHPSCRPKGEIVAIPEMAINTKKKRTLICQICDRKFLNNSSLRQHLSFHQPQRPYECNQIGCSKSYKTRSELNRHLIVHTGEKKYGCIKCGKTFLRKQYLKTHLIRHNEGLTWQCSQCAKIFVSEEDLSKHKVSYHKNGKRASLKMIRPLRKLALTFFHNPLDS